MLSFLRFPSQSKHYLISLFNYSMKVFSFLLIWVYVYDLYEDKISTNVNMFDVLFGSIIYVLLSAIACLLANWYAEPCSNAHWVKICLVQFWYDSIMLWLFLIIDEQFLIDT